MIFHKANKSKQSAFNTAGKIQKLCSRCPSHRGLSSEQSVIGLIPKFTSLCYGDLLLQNALTSTETAEALCWGLFLFTASKHQNNAIYKKKRLSASGFQHCPLQRVVEERRLSVPFPPDTAAEVMPSELL